MRTLIKIIFIVTIGIMASNKANTNDCQTPQCFGNSCGCSNWSAWEERMEAFDMGPFGFPLCTLWVWYCYRQCLDPGKENCVEIFISAIQGRIPYCGECDGFIEWLTSGDEWVQARKGRNLLNYLFRQIVLRDWFKFLEDIPREAWPYCDELDRRKYTWWMASCRGYCYTQYPVGQPNVRLLITIKDCMESYCCGREIELCVDRETGETRMQINRIGGPPTDCSNMRVPLSECPPGTNVQSTWCIDNCEDVE